jgi:hypothetical protein
LIPIRVPHCLRQINSDSLTLTEIHIHPISFTVTHRPSLI